CEEFVGTPREDVSAVRRALERITGHVQAVARLIAVLPAELARPNQVPGRTELEYVYVAIAEIHEKVVVIRAGGDHQPIVGRDGAKGAVVPIAIGCPLKIAGLVEPEDPRPLAFPDDVIPS